MKIIDKFYDMYLSNLNKISSEKYIDNFLTIDSKIEEINSHIYADYFMITAEIME